jgi:hypothetical protein
MLFKVLSSMLEPMRCEVMLHRGNLHNMEIYKFVIRNILEGRVLRRIFGRKRDEVTGKWKKKIHNEEIRDLYSSPSITRITKSRMMRWAVHVTRMGRKGTRIVYF